MVPPSVCGTLDAVLRELVGEHQRGAAEVELGVADAAARLAEAELLGGAEGPLVELDRLGGVLHAQIREQLVDGHAGLLLDGTSPFCRAGPPRVLNEIDLAADRDVMARGRRELPVLARRDACELAEVAVEMRLVAVAGREREIGPRRRGLRAATRASAVWKRRMRE